MGKKKKKKKVESIAVQNPLMEDDEMELADGEDGESGEEDAEMPEMPMSSLSRVAENKSKTICGMSERMVIPLISAVTATAIIAVIYSAMLATNPDDNWSTDVPRGAMFDVTADPNQGR